MHLKNSMALVSEFSMGGVSTTNNMELCADAKKSNGKYYMCPGFWAELSPAFTPAYYLKDESLI